MEVLAFLYNLIMHVLSLTQVSHTTLRECTMGCWQFYQSLMHIKYKGEEIAVHGKVGGWKILCMVYILSMPRRFACKQFSFESIHTRPSD